MIASEFMTENPRTIRATDSLRDALDALQSMQVRHLPVVDEEGNLVGMLSDRDLGSLTRVFLEDSEPDRAAAKLANRRVSEIMSADPVSVDPDAPTSAIIETMLTEHIGAVPVVDGDGMVMGIISYVDVLRAMSQGASD